MVLVHTEQMLSICERSPWRVHLGELVVERRCVLQSLVQQHGNLLIMEHDVLHRAQLPRYERCTRGPPLHTATHT